MKYVALDYDGFICKSFFAAHRDEVKAEEILDDLTRTAIDKAFDYFQTDDIKAYYVVSGHSWKKDLYPDYKATREKDPYVGAFRDYIINITSNIIKPESLEADELCIMLHDYAVEKGHECIIFSDDKDLRYSSLINCKVNLTEKIDLSYDERYLYEQMLAGDKEDDIKGINKVGMKTAERLLDANGFNIEGVIKTYRDKEVPKEECKKNINLIIPMKREFNTKPNTYDEICRRVLKDGNTNISDHLITVIQKGQLEYINRKVDAIYER